MLLCDPDTHLPPVQLQLPSFFKFGVEISLWDNSISVSGKIKCVKMRFTTFLQILELLSRSKWSGISISLARTIGILPGTQVVYLSFLTSL